MEQGVQTALNGVKMEIEDATYPLVRGTVTTGDAKVRAFPPLLMWFLPSFCTMALRRGREEKRQDTRGVEERFS